jgi:hypothetical protein
VPPTTDWNAKKTEILSRLDIRSVYEEWGAEFTRSAPTSKHWLECWALGREHGDRPNAAVNVGSGPDRGYYDDKGHGGERLSLWDAGARYGPYATWEECRRVMAERAGVPLPSRAGGG